MTVLRYENVESLLLAAQLSKLLDVQHPDWSQTHRGHEMYALQHPVSLGDVILKPLESLPLPLKVYCDTCDVSVEIR